MAIYLSICIPAYKRIDYLKRLLLSIERQSYKNFEVIVSDDSDDNSVYNLLQTFNKLVSIQYFKNTPSLGTPANWNSAISELRNFGDAFATRRNKEADLLQYTGTTSACPAPGNDICRATRGSCVTSTTCTKVLLNNFCQNQASSVRCCV